MLIEPEQLRYPGPYPVFFVGASAGGVAALQYLAEQLPPEFPAPLFFVLHRKRSTQTAKGLMRKLLQNKSRLTVCEPEHGDVVKAGHIYLPPADAHLGVEDNRIVHLQEPSTSPWRPSIDVLLKTGARDYRERAVSILLTGGLDDGVEGLKETTYQGGLTVAQSPSDAYDPVLPLNALLADHPAYVLPLRDMPALLCELAGFTLCAEQQTIARRAATAARVEKAQLKQLHEMPTGPDRRNHKPR